MPTTGSRPARNPRPANADELDEAKWIERASLHSALVEQLNKIRDLGLISDVEYRAEREALRRGLAAPIEADAYAIWT